MAIDPDIEREAALRMKHNIRAALDVWDADKNTALLGAALASALDIYIGELRLSLVGPSTDKAH